MDKTSWVWSSTRTLPIKRDSAPSLGSLQKEMASSEDRFFLVRRIWMFFMVYPPDTGGRMVISVFVIGVFFSMTSSPFCANLECSMREARSRCDEVMV